MSEYDSEDEALLTTKDVARRLGISERTVYRWRRESLGPPFLRLSKAASSIRYDAAKLEQWIDEQTDKATAGG